VHCVGLTGHAFSRAAGSQRLARGACTLIPGHEAGRVDCYAELGRTSGCDGAAKPITDGPGGVTCIVCKSLAVTRLVLMKNNSWSSFMPARAASHSSSVRRVTTEILVRSCAYSN